MSIRLEMVEKSYKRKVLNGINLKISDGECVCIMGPSGTGKSTLLKILALTSRETRGKYYIDGRDMSLLSDDKRSNIVASEIGYVDQEIYLFDSMTIYDNLILAINIKGVSIDKKHLNYLCEQFDIEKILNKYPYEVSGGERQRVVIVRNLAKKPKFLLMDEPTSSLDYKSSKILMELLIEYQKQSQTTIIIVTHNSNIASYANRVILLRDGNVFTNIYPSGNDFETEIINCLNGMYRREDDRI